MIYDIFIFRAFYELNSSLLFLVEAAVESALVQLYGHFGVSSWTVLHYEIVIL